MPRNDPTRRGPGGNCICPKCGRTQPHQRGVPCQDEQCPACGVKLLREGSYHHDLLIQRKSRDGKTK
jgi:hypothetical protein